MKPEEIELLKDKLKHQGLTDKEIYNRIEKDMTAQKAKRVEPIKLNFKDEFRKLKNTKRNK